MLSKVIIHVGPSKTGTTTIQHFLSANRDELLRANIFYPSTVPDSNEGHPSLAWDVLRDLDKPVAYLSRAYISWKDALEHAYLSGADTLLISSEDFSLEEFDEFAWRKIHSLTKHIDVKVLFGLRDPSSIVIGMWKQAVVWGVGFGEEILSLDQAIPLIGQRRRIQVIPFIELVQRCLPSATINCFSVPKCKNTNLLLARFFEAAGLSDRTSGLKFQESTHVLNESVPNSMVRMMLRLNILLNLTDPQSYKYPFNGSYCKIQSRKYILDALKSNAAILKDMDTTLSDKSQKVLIDLRNSVSSWAASQTLCGTSNDLQSDFPVANLMDCSADSSADTTLVTLAVKALQEHILSTSEQVTSLQDYLPKVEEARDWWRQQSDAWQKIAESKAEVSTGLQSMSTTADGAG